MSKEDEITRMLDNMLNTLNTGGNLGKYSFAVNDIEEAKVLIKNEHYERLSICTPEILCTKIDGKSVYEILLENNIPVPSHIVKDVLEIDKWNEIDLITDDIVSKKTLVEAIQNLYQKGKLEELSNVDKTELLEIEIEKDKMLIDVLLENNIFPKLPGEITDMKIIKSVIEHKAIDFYEKIDPYMLFHKYDLNRTFMDVIMEQKKEDNSINVRIPSTPGETKAKIILAYCKNGFKRDLTLTVSSLISKNSVLGKNLLDFMLDEDRETTLNNVLSEKAKEHPTIKIALMLHDFKGKVFEAGNIKERFEKGKLEEYSKMQVSQEEEKLLEKLREALTDEMSEPYLVNMMVLNYRRLFAEKNPCAYEVFHIIEMKENGANFSIKSSPYQEGNSYNPINNAISLRGKNIKAYNHEIGHALFQNITLRKMPPEFEEVIKRIAENPDTLKKVYMHNLEYSKAEREVRQKVSELLEEEYSSYVTDEQIKEVDEYLKTVKIPREEIKKIFAKHPVITAKEFLEKEKEIKRKECERLIFENTYPDLASVADILDAIYKGKYFEGKLNYEDKTLKCKWGHGEEYYMIGMELVFNEILADYSRIIKTPNPQEGLEKLRLYVGDELVELLNKYYQENIINIIGDQINNLQEDNNMVL